MKTLSILIVMFLASASTCFADVSSDARDAMGEASDVLANEDNVHIEVLNMKNATGAQRAAYVAFDFSTLTDCETSHASQFDTHRADLDYTDGRTMLTAGKRELDFAAELWDDANAAYKAGNYATCVDRCNVCEAKCDLAGSIFGYTYGKLSGAYDTWSDANCYLENTECNSDCVECGGECGGGGEE